MPLYNVTFENGQSLLVNADNGDGAKAHADLPHTRQPFLGRPGPPPDTDRPSIDLQTPVKSVVEVTDKFASRAK